jgi:hypothetical protein
MEAKSWEVTHDESLAGCCGVVKLIRISAVTLPFLKYISGHSRHYYVATGTSFCKHASLSTRGVSKALLILASPKTLLMPWLFYSSSPAVQFGSVSS